jgi:hypothetical protein
VAVTKTKMLHVRRYLRKLDSTLPKTSISHDMSIYVKKSYLSNNTSDKVTLVTMMCIGNNVHCFSGDYITICVIYIYIYIRHFTSISVFPVTEK